MDAFFASKWAECPVGVVRAIRNPWSQEIIDTVPECGGETVDLAMEKLFAGKDSLAVVSSERMGEIFTAARQAMEDTREELAHLITREQGKPIQESLREVNVTINLLESFGKDAFRLGRQFLPLATEARVADRFGYTRRRPYGITALLTPNTFPFLIPAMLMIPALAAGNAIVVNPASQTPFSALKLLQILLEAGMPEDAMACLTGPGERTGQAICRHPLVDQITCYGGSATIRAIRSACEMIPLQFHHGGMGVCVVDKSGDLDLAADQIVSQAFENSGQTAVSTSAIFADETICEALLERLSSRIGGLKMGNPEEEGTTIGPLTESFRAVRAARLIGDLTASGSRCLNGDGINDGNMMQPTLIADIHPENPRFFPKTGSREVLAPIVGVCPVKGKLEQVAGWLDSRSQLSVSIFSEDLERATLLANSLPVFNVHVNGVPTWRDGLIFDPSSSIRLGRRKSRSRVNDLSISQDIVFHQAPGA
ncbi:MAG: aldehyde dehydrogenase family protein [Verrucomicrobiae bacterium]|nr:aldehyde dehydrogenase family protein [Verrucomicrobiae bacterium]